MKYKQRRRLYSQNFLHEPKLVTKLIRNSSIGNKDIVLEIGPGRGIITQQLLKKARTVIAVELDPNLYKFLKDKFDSASNLKLYKGNFLDFKLPPQPYKVFANVPFIITSDVIKKLTSDNNLIEAYLIIQKEAAKKFIGIPIDLRNSMMTSLLKPWFKIDIIWSFNRSDFIPKPSVSCVMINMKRLKKPLIPYKQKKIFRDFVVYTYNRSKVARLDFSELLELFDKYLYKASRYQKGVVSSRAQKILSEQKTLQKIHRSRTDKHWKTKKHPRHI